MATRFQVVFDVETREGLQKAQTFANSIGASLQKVETANKSLEQTGSGTLSRLNSFYDQHQAKVDSAARSIGVGLAGIAASLTAVAGFALHTAIQFESAFLGVVKTVDATESQLAQLRVELSDMTREVPLAAEEIFGIAEAAGQLGIKTENVSEFTRVMADLGATTNLSANDAATALARLDNITGGSQENFARMGATIVDLGNNMATTEAEIVEFALRIAGAGNTVGLTQDQILGFAAALSSVGLKAEAGGTAISRVMLEINSAVLSGGDSLDRFASIADQSAGDFAASFRKNAATAVVDFIGGLGRLQESGQDVKVTLSELGLDGIRVLDVMQRLGGAGDLVTEALDIANTAWMEQSALVKEASIRYGSAESQLQLFWNIVRLLADEFGQALIPVLIQLLDTGKPVLDWGINMVKTFRDLPDVVQLTTITIGGLGTVLLGVSGTLLIFLPQIVNTVRLIGELGGVSGTASIALKGLRVVGITPLTVAVAAATAALGFLIVKYGQWKLASMEAEAQASRVAQVNFTLDRLFGKSTDQFREFLGTVDESTRALFRQELQQRALASRGLPATSEKYREMILLLDDYINQVDNSNEVTSEAVLQLQSLAEAFAAGELTKPQALQALADFRDQYELLIETSPELEAMLKTVERQIRSVGDAAEDEREPLKRLFTTAGDVATELGMLQQSIAAEGPAAVQAVKALDSLVSTHGDLIRISPELQSMLLGLVLEIREMGGTVPKAVVAMLPFHDAMRIGAEMAKEERDRLAELQAQIESILFMQLDAKPMKFIEFPDEEKPDLVFDVSPPDDVEDTLKRSFFDKLKGQFEGFFKRDFGAIMSDVTDIMANVFGVRLPSIAQAGLNAIVKYLQGDFIGAFLSAASALVGILKGVFEKASVKEFAERLGFDLSKGLVESIEAAREKTGGDIEAAFRLLLGDVIRDVGIESLEDLREFSTLALQTLSMVDAGYLSSAQATGALTDSVGELLKAAKELDAGMDDLQGILDIYRDTLSRTQSGQLDVADTQRFMNGTFEDLAEILLGQGSAGVQQVIDLLQQASAAGLDTQSQWEFAAQTLIDMGESGQDALVQLVEGARAAGVEISAVTEHLNDLQDDLAAKVDERNKFIRSSADTIIGSVRRLLDAVSQEVTTLAEDGTEQVITQYNLSERQARLAASQMLTAFKAMTAAGVPIVEIARQMGEEFGIVVDQLEGRYPPVLNDINTLFQKLSEEGPQRVVERISAISDGMMAVADLGRLTAEDFDDWGDSIDSAMRRLQTQGFTAEEAMMALQPQLQALFNAQQMYGFEVDRNTQRLLDQAVAQGIVKDEGMSAADIQLRAYDAMIRALNQVIVALGGVPIELEEWNQATETLRTNTETNRQKWLEFAGTVGLSARDARQLWKDAGKDIRDQLNDVSGLGRRAFIDLMTAAGLSAKEARQAWRQARQDTVGGSSILDIRDRGVRALLQLRDAAVEGPQSMASEWEAQVPIVDAKIAELAASAASQLSAIPVRFDVDSLDFRVGQVRDGEFRAESFQTRPGEIKIVPGDSTDGRMVEAHGGEAFGRAIDVRSFQRMFDGGSDRSGEGGRGGGDVHIHITVEGDVVTEDELTRKLEKRLAKLFRSQFQV